VGEGLLSEKLAQLVIMLMIMSYWLITMGGNEAVCFDGAKGELSGREKVEVEVEAGPQHSKQRAVEKRAAASPQQQLQHQSAAPMPPARPSNSGRPARISEADLLPFSDFVVNQPAFSDIMKSWPPTTLKHLNRERQEEPKRPKWWRANRHREAQGPSLSSGAGSHHMGQYSEVANYDQLNEIHNHLNEDLDDTIVTADESFELDQLAEPATWVNYLADLGDFIYTQLRQFYESSPKSPFLFKPEQQQSQSGEPSSEASSQPAAESKLIETVDDLLDDFYYDQYENSQVLYYGPQLAREGDIIEIGCYLPRDQPAEWTKSGRPLQPRALLAGQNGSHQAIGGGQQMGELLLSSSGASLSVVRRSEFLGAKQNFSLKIFEAQRGDSGNYRCNRMSRKYHKLVVVPSRLASGQLYAIQQRLLQVLAGGGQQQQQQQQASLAAQAQAWWPHADPMGPQVQPIGRQHALQQRPAAQAKISVSASTRLHNSAGTATDTLPEGAHQQRGASSNSYPNGKQRFQQQQQQLLLPGHIIVQGQPLLVACNISDEFVLRRLRELPQFQLAWYKNGRLLRASQQPASNHSGPQTASSSAPNSAARFQTATSSPATNQQHKTPQRIAFVGPNGRQMYISSALYADAGDYLCSWSRLPARQVSIALLCASLLATFSGRKRRRDKAPALQLSSGARRA